MSKTKSRMRVSAAGYLARGQERKNVGCQTPVHGRRSCASAGFSLMEVLVAVSLLGIAYTTIFSLMTTSLGNVSRLEEREKAVRYAGMKLNELVLRNQQGEEDYPLSGKFDDIYRWRAEVSPYGVDAEAVKTRPIVPVRIRLTVQRVNHSAEEIYSLETIGWKRKLP